MFFSLRTPLALKGINLLFSVGRLYTVISNVSILLAKLMNNGNMGQEKLENQPLTTL